MNALPPHAPSDGTILYFHPPEFRSLGRNGYLNTCGLSVSLLMWGDVTIQIEPITSKGRLGRCRIVAPRTAIPHLIQARTAIRDSIKPNQP